MNRVQDIHISDKELKSQYINSFINEDFNLAFNLLLNPSVQNKKFTKDLINSLSTKLLNLENFYFVNVPNFLNNELINFQEIVDNFIFLGEWNSSTVYQSYNSVVYNNNIYMYIGDESTVGIPPNYSGNVTLIIDTFVESSNDEDIGVIIQGGVIDSQGILSTDNLYIDNNWILLDITGAKGADGIGIIYKGNWDSTFSYDLYDAVFYNDSFYVCRQLNQNIVPTNNTYWSQVFTVKRTKIEDFSSVNNPYNGLICLETI